VVKRSADHRNVEQRKIRIPEGCQKSDPLFEGIRQRTAL
jgi:hypothetical protein